MCCHQEKCLVDSAPQAVKAYAAICRARARELRSAAAGQLQRATRYLALRDEVLHLFRLPPRVRCLSSGTSPPLPQRLEFFMGSTPPARRAGTRSMYVGALGETPELGASHHTHTAAVEISCR